ncbi:relaxase/mobilization nuclease domain-containing protein [Paraburkholderia bryophila]|uniref:relaxase/mobilization nuclease domain-containing protein n=1 Tax=Paraburkholderia bryophila TaxID=420952 RepID=UPI00234A1D99|nr:relaxase/mobilization nuclease domain-containing protein [Paraburkholderia bryophila]WCM23168.1 relaxase/mobilization nuclease domain-containing protein [Paraburkholderia bryophila]
MIVRIFNSGTSRGEPPVNYLLGERDHTGKLRAVKPEVLEGDPRTTVAIINSIPRKHKYISGAISFRDTEHPTKEQLRTVIDEFKASFAPGLTSDNFNSLWVIHRDKGNTELHFVVPRVELATGKAFNIHPPGRKNIEHYEAFTSVMNHKLGYAQIQPDPLKLALSEFEFKTPEGKKSRCMKEPMHQQLEHQIRSGAIRNRAQLCEALEGQFGLKITRWGADYIAVMIPGEKKARRLRGAFYSSQADYAELLRTPLPPRFLTSSQATAIQDWLSQFIIKRRDFNIKAYLAPRKMRHQQLADRRTTSNRPVASTIMQQSGGRGWTARVPTWLMPATVTSAVPAIRHTPLEPYVTATSSAAMPAGDSANEIISAIKEVERSIVSASASVANAKSAVARHRALRLLAKLEVQKARLKKQLGKAQEQASAKMKL